MPEVGGWVVGDKRAKQDIYPIDFPRLKQEDLGRGGLTLKILWEMLRSQLLLPLQAVE